MWVLPMQLLLWGRSWVRPNDRLVLEGDEWKSVQHLCAVIWLIMLSAAWSERLDLIY